MRILYLIQTPWNWILQRSQIIELGLEKSFDCTVLDKKIYPLKKEILNNTVPKKIKFIPQIRGGSIGFINSINRILYKIFVSLVIKKYDAVWLCYPIFYEAIPSQYKGKIIYDCMDDHVAMAPASKKNLVDSLENELISRADMVFASSQRLIDIKPGMEKAFLVRNGFVANQIYEPKKSKIKQKYDIGYFGAIESWFDFEKIISSTNKYKNRIEYHLIGPFKKEKFQFLAQDTEAYLTSNSIYLEGVVRHEKLYDKIKGYDALIMPFVVNDIILSVDPVKLYEYISYGKCVISVWYPEIDRFSPYVYFYKTEEEFLQLLNILVENGFAPKYTQSQQQTFLNSNSWEKRCNEISDILKNSLENL